LDLPPGAERTVQYADFLGPVDGAQGKPRMSFLLVTIPSEVARGVVARSVAALSRGSNRLLGYVENMSGYYCRDCDAIKPLFLHREASPRRPSPLAHSLGPHDPRSVHEGRVPGERDPSGLGIPCFGTVPFDPELARHCDLGLPFSGLRETPAGVALEQIAQRLLDSLADAGKEPHS
jgi:Mrp family chromosome partitioning ATPase